MIRTEYRGPLKRVSLVMPTKNEIEGLRAVLPRIDRTLFDEIIVADGHSTDGTADFARAQGLKLVMQPGVGLPDAEEAAFRESTGDIVVFFTPDGNSLPERLSAVIDKIREGYDMVVVSRYLDGARSEDDDILTALGNFMFTRIINLLFWANHTDVLVGFRAMTREAIEKMSLLEQVHENWMRRTFYLMNTWEVGASIRAPRAGLRSVDIPGDEPKRIGGVRKMSIIKNGLGGVMQILWDFFTYWPKKTQAQHGQFPEVPAKAA